MKIATAADFNGNRWTNNAVMLQTPRGVSYLMPVGSIARLFKWGLYVFPRAPTRLALFSAVAVHQGSRTLEF